MKELKCFNTMFYVSHISYEKFLEKLNATYNKLKASGIENVVVNLNEDDRNVELYGQRLETDDEYGRRINNEQNYEKVKLKEALMVYSKKYPEEFKNLLGELEDV